MESPNRPYSSNGGASSRRRVGRGSSGKRGSAAPDGRKPRRESVPSARRAPGAVPDVSQDVDGAQARALDEDVGGAGRVRGAAVAPLASASGHARASVTTATADVKDARAADDAPLVTSSGTQVDGGQEAAGGVITVDDFEAIFERFQTPLVNFVFRLVGNREQALDLTQDVFVKVYRALSSGTTIQAGALSSWLYRIASNTATDALRRRRLIAWLPLSLFNDDRGIGAGVIGESSGQQSLQGEETITAAAAGSFGPDYDGAVFDQRVADSDLVAGVLRKLPTKYAECLLLYEHEGYSCAEIAEILHVSPSAVKMRLMRARERFIELYKKETANQ